MPQRPDWLGAAVGLEGECYEELGKNPDAAWLQRALGTAPNNLTARVGYSRLASYLPSPPASGDAAARRPRTPAAARGTDAAKCLRPTSAPAAARTVRPKRERSG